MSAERRGPGSSLPVDDRWRISHLNSTVGSNHWNGTPPRRPVADSDRPEPPLSYRIERTRLRARIAALEQALETSENRRQTVIDQYERLLSDQNESVDSESASEPSQSLPLLARLVGR